MRKRIRVITTTLCLLLFPAIFYYLSPVIPLGASIEGIISGSLIVFASLFILSLFFGRLFCSYVCPGGTIQDLVRKANDKTFPRKKLNWIKYLIWGPWILLLLVLFYRSGGVKEIVFTYQTTKGFSVADLPSLIIYLLVVLTFFLLPLLFGRRSACHTICWMAPFMILGKKVGDIFHTPSLHIHSDSERCIACKRCTTVCPMSLEVDKLQQLGSINSSDCIVCGDCVDICPTSTLSFSFSKHKKGVI